MMANIFFPNRFSAVLYLNINFKLNSGRVSITLQEKTKFYPEGERHEKKSISKTPYLLDWLSRKTSIFFNTCANIVIYSERAIN